MLTLVAFLALAQTPQHWLQRQPNLPQGESLPAFSAFGASGRGTSGACSTTPPTGAKGETLIFTRSSNATCSKRGNATSGYTAGDLVVLSTDQARVEPSLSGVLGARWEAAETNLLPRFIAIANALWSDIGTPTLTGGQTSPWAGTYASSAVQVTDDDGAAFEGRQQTIAVTSGQPLRMYCLVMGVGSLTSASITIDGTAASITGLSTTSFSLVEAVDAAASSTSITVQVRAGSVASDTGSVIWGGCQVAHNTKMTSIIPTDATTASRASEVGARFAISFPFTTASMAATAWTTSAQSVTGPQWLSLESVYGEASPRALGYSNAGVANTFISGAGLLSTGAPWASGSHRMSMSTARAARYDATATSSAAVSLASSPTVVVLSGNNAAGLPCDCILSEICVDPNEDTCR